MTLSEAIEIASAIIRCYPNGGKDAGDGYIGALAAVLGAYPRSIALRSADPVRGIPSENHFLPTPADMVAWFERQIKPLIQQYERETRLHQQFDERQAFEAIAVARSDRLSIPELKQKYGDWHDGWRPLGELANKLAQAARETLTEQIGEQAFDAIPDGPQDRL